MADIDNLSIQISASVSEAINSINGLTEALRSLNEELGRINPGNLASITNAANTASSAIANLQTGEAAVQSVANAFNNLTDSGGQIEQVGDAATNMGNAIQTAAENVNEASTSTSNMTAQTQQLGQALNTVTNNARAAASRIRDVSVSCKLSIPAFKGITKELTRISKMLKLMITRMILRKIIQGVIDGFKNLAQYSSTFDATLSLLWNDLRQLGNSIAAAVSPLLNALAPALHYVIQLFIEAINYINQFISALTGLNSFTRAKVLTDDYAKSLDKSNKSAKALKKTVLSFDELNQLQKKNDSGNTGTDPKDMFEEVPIDPKILKIIDELKKKLGELKPYWDRFVEGFKKGLGDDWKTKVGMILDGLSRIGDALLDIWSDPAVTKARNDYFMSLAEMLGTVAGTFVRIGLNIGANLAQGIAGALEEKTPEIKDYLVEMFSIGTEVNKQLTDYALAIGNISDVLVGDNAIAATKGFTEIFLEAFMLISENAARLGGEIVTLVTQPIIDNQDAIKDAFDDMFGILAELTDAIQDAIKDVRKILKDTWDNHLHPMFQSLTEALSKIVALVLKVWGYISPVIHEFIGVLSELWKQYLEPLADDVINIIGILGNLIAKFFNYILVPWLEELVDKWMPRIQDVLSILVSAIKLVFEVASTILEDITFQLRAFLQFFETGFTEGWDKALQELTDSWTEHWDSMDEKVRGIANSVVEIVEKMINAIVRAVNGIGGKINDKLKDVEIPKWLGGGKINIKVPHLEEVKLPRFKKGGFLDEDGLFLANSSELIGKFNNGRTAVANNEQIINGISAGVYNAVTAAMANNNGGNNSGYIANTIVVDGEVIARTITKAQQKQNMRYSPQMG